MTKSQGWKLSLPLSNAQSDTVDQSSLRGAIVAFDGAGNRVVLLHTQDQTVAAPFSDENIAYLAGLGIVAQWPFEEPSQSAAPSEPTPAAPMDKLKEKLDLRRSAPEASPAKDELN